MMKDLGCKVHAYIDDYMVVAPRGRAVVSLLQDLGLFMNSQLYVHLSHMNASAAFDKLNRCLQDAKEWMLASKINQDKRVYTFWLQETERKVKCMFPN